MSEQSYWAEYKFMLVPGSDVKTITQATIGANAAPDERPYHEEHSGEKGIVFFPTIQAAKAYQTVRKLTNWQLAFVPDPESVVSISIRWGCHVAYSIHFDGKEFRQDVTEITHEPRFVHDGQRRWGHPSR